MLEIRHPISRPQAGEKYYTLKFSPTVEVCVSKHDCKPAGDGTLVSTNPAVNKVLDNFFNCPLIFRDGDTFRQASYSSTSSSSAK